MNDVFLLQILTWTSFYYTFTLGFFNIGSFTALAASFFLHVLITAVHFTIQFKSFHSKYCLLLCLLPVLWIQSVPALIFCVVYLILSFYLSRYYIGSEKISIESVVKSVYSLLITLYAVYFVLFEAFQGLLILRIEFIWPALGAFILSSTLLLRTARHADEMKDLSKIRRSNLLFAIGVIGSYALIAMSNFRSFLGELLLKFFSPFQLLLYPFNWIFSRFFISDDFFDPLENFQATQGEQEELNQEIIDEVGGAFTETSEVLDFQMLSRFIDIFWRLMVLIFLAIIIRKAWNSIVAKTKKSSKDGIISEERFFIKRKKQKKRNFWLNPNRYPKSNSERIRYFYRKHLNLLSKMGIDLKSHYTSDDICHQAMDARVKHAKDIQKQYIETRYGEKPCDDQEVKRMKKWVD